MQSIYMCYPNCFPRLLCSHRNAAPATTLVTMQDGAANFRSHYYEKVGFRGVDERKTLESLLSEDPVHLDKCSSFALKCSVPSDYRLQLWTCLLRVCSLYPGNRSYVDEWRRRPYHEAREALEQMGKVRRDRPAAQNLSIVYLLFSKKLKFDVDRQLEENCSVDFMAVAETVGSMFPSDEPTAFWVAKQMHERLSGPPAMGKLRDRLIQMGHDRLAGEGSTKALYSHMDKIGFAQELPFRAWFSRGFAGVLHRSALAKIWDKVIGGSFVILVYVAAALVETTKTSLLGCQTPKEALRCLTSTTAEADEQIAQKAIDAWSRDGHALLPPPVVVASATSVREKSGETTGSGISK